jgi:hypothetical protein
MTDEELTKMLRSSANRVVNYAGDRIEALTAERDRLREALAMIDAIDPEHHIDGCAQAVVRGLVLRMGEAARASLKGESHE